MTRLHPEDLQALAKLVAAELLAQASDDAMVGASEIASMTGFSQRHVAERITRAPGFPAPARLVKGGERRWRRGDVLAYLASPRQPKPGRQRNPVQL